MVSPPLYCDPLAGAVKLTLGGKLLSTVSTAFVLVTLPKLLVTTTR